MTQTTYDELILLPSLRAQRGPNGGLVLTQKYLNGVAEYQKTWPGRIASLVNLSNTATSDMDHVEVPPTGGAVRLEVRPQDADELAERIRNAAAVLAFLSPFELELASICRKLQVPLIYVSEYSPNTEKQIIDASIANPLLRWRRKLWVNKAERSRLSALKLAAGIQCSGTPTYNIYKHANSRAMLFFDNRVPIDAVIDESSLNAKLESQATGRPLRLVFGGRLIAMKGVTQLPKVALELKRLGVKFSLDIYGSGDLEGEIKSDIERFGLQNEVALKGVLDFEKGWVPLLKEQVDLFLCSHPQGDPSSTYPEVMSCGVPIAGYDNEAFTGIVEQSGCGWLARLNHPRELAAIVARLDQNRAELATAARKGRLFAATHAFEKTFSSRVGHMVALSRLPPQLKAAVNA